MILGQAREELDRADNKASLLLVAAMVVMSVVLAAILAGQWRPFGMSWIFQTTWWIGVTVGVGALASLAVAVYPRSARSRDDAKELLAYFGDAAGKTPTEIRTMLRREARDDEPMIDQLLAVSGIVDRKYRAIRIGLWLFAIAAVCCAASVALDHFLR